MTAISVMIRWATPTAVRGRVQRLRILIPPPWVVWVMAMMTRLAPASRSMAPPMPGTFTPGMIQLAMLPCSSTSRVPRMVMSRWPPRARAKEVRLSM